MKNALKYQSIGRGFVMIDYDCAAIEDKVITGYQLKESDTNNITTLATEIGQLLRLSLFPGTTASYGFYSIQEGGKPFHLERYYAMTGEY
jgi:hypothetical protein